MNARTALRLCHSGMEGRSLDAFQIFLSRVEPFACRITDEGDADAAFIDADGYLGKYLLEGHRLLYPGRPLIVTSARPGNSEDPLTIEITKPVGLAAFSRALDKVRNLLPRTRDALPEESTDEDETLANIPDDFPASALIQPPPTQAMARQTAGDQVNRLRQLEEGLATHYVGTMPDVDLENPRQLETVFYAPDNFLQGSIRRAVAHAREIGRPVKLTGPIGTVLLLDPRHDAAFPALTPNALRAQAQLPTRGTVHMAPVETRDASLLSRIEARPLRSLEWDVALWASRGRLPFGTNIDAPIRLRRWPNLTRLVAPPEAIRIAGLWSRNTVTLRETVALLGVPQRYVFGFYSACAALGLVAHPDPATTPARPPAPPSASVATSDAAPPMRGLFKRLLGKLLGARVGEDPPGHK